jgi:hypothetical protein
MAFQEPTDTLCKYVPSMYIFVLLAYYDGSDANLALKRRSLIVVASGTVFFRVVMMLTARVLAVEALKLFQPLVANVCNRSTNTQHLISSSRPGCLDFLFVTLMIMCANIGSSYRWTPRAVCSVHWH